MTPAADLPVVVALLAVCVALLALLVRRWVPAQPRPLVDPDAVAADFTVHERARERAFRRSVRPWSLLGLALGLVVPTAVVVLGLARALVDVVPGPWWWRALVLVLALLALTRLTTLPGAILMRRRSLGVGLATGPWRRWWRDLAVSSALGWALTSAALLGWLAAVRWWPQRWWVPVGVVAAVLVVVMSWVVPVVVEPLFARFAPLPESPLRERVQGLARAAGVEVRDVLVADASRRTTALNAYVSGLGSTRRVVLFDTLVDSGRDDEAASVVAHELGHVVAADVRAGTLLGSVGAVGGVLAAAVVLSSSRVLDVGHVVGLDDPALAGLLLVLGAWAGLATAPLQSAVSRRIERRADAFCLDLTGDPGTVASMQRSLAITNLAPLVPWRLLHLWFGTHPTTPERIAAAREWARAHGAVVPALAPSEG